ncbi:protein SanA, affects membrane permeability for vancomycin [Micromonospora pallida]|uniref:Protein SanA, affects membrane permeability for vancomycin n=1 Tax=Micromonospora pallida TaxID=145854 RepID=A0A1C6RU83_9ACTN|nr:protein SanA, affects membrane permeability for vancomycin [Micromonospora pallida]
MIRNKTARHPTKPRQKRKQWRRILLGPMLAIAVATPAAVLGSGAWVGARADGHIYRIDDVPDAPVVLVLGARVDPDGTPSSFLAARLELARQLYENGTARAILVSGDQGSRAGYDEPGAMRRWLVERGVPNHKIVQDHAGYDTYDSCIRARQVFGVEHMIVVTQSFHIERAVALCREAGIDTTGVGDNTVRHQQLAWLRGAIRERAANIKAVADIITGRDPSFLGPRQTGIDDAMTTP